MLIMIDYWSPWDAQRQKSGNFTNSQAFKMEKPQKSVLQEQSSLTGTKLICKSLETEGTQLSHEQKSHQEEVPAGVKMKHSSASGKNKVHLKSKQAIPTGDSLCSLPSGKDEWTQSWTCIQKPFRLNFSHFRSDRNSNWATSQAFTFFSPVPSSCLLKTVFLPSITVIRPPRCSLNRSKKRFLGAVLIVSAIFCCLPIDSCQPEV